MLVAWLELVSNSRCFPEGFFSVPLKQIFLFYVKSHISAPEGLRNTPQTENREEIVELRDSDLEEYSEQLTSVTQLGRHVLEDVLPFLNGLLQQKMHTFANYLRAVNEKGIRIDLILEDVFLI